MATAFGIVYSCHLAPVFFYFFLAFVCWDKVLVCFQLKSRNSIDLKGRAEAGKSSKCNGFIRSLLCSVFIFLFLFDSILLLFAFDPSHFFSLGCMFARGFWHARS